MQTIVFLGIFDKIANWIFSGLSKAITWLVSNVIAPICSVIWENFLAYIWEILSDIVCSILYQIYVFILEILYAIETAAYSFAGAVDVTYGSESNNILSIIFTSSNVKSAFVYITCLSLVLLFLFTVVAVMRSTLDFSYDNKASVGAIMTSFIQSCVTFLILPVLCYGLVDLASRVMTSMYKATSLSGGLSITDNLFLMSAKSGITTDQYNELKTAVTNNKMFWTSLTSVSKIIGGAKYIDFFVGFIGAVILIINLLGMCAVFIQRIIEITILYVVSPFFVSTMPLDDGQRYGKWRSTFIGRLCMGVGMIIGLNIVMMLISLLLSGSDGYTISFTDTSSGSLSNTSVDILLKLIFMIGAITSVKHVGTAVTGIMDQDAAQAGERTFNDTVKSIKEAPGNAFKKIENFEKMTEKMSEMQAAHRARKNSMKSYNEGFQGDVANSAELDFTKSIRNQNSKNKAQAAFTKRGAKYAALNDQVDKGNETLKAFSALKTHEEREAFMKDFKAKGGTNSLKVDGSKFGSSEMTNMKERGALNNIDERMANTKNARDQFAVGSAQWNKYNNDLNKMAGLKKGFDALSTHKERENYMAKHKEFGKTESKTSAEKKAASNIDTRLSQWKEYRDSLPRGSAERAAADAACNDLQDKKAAYEAASSSEERSKIEAGGNGAFTKPFTNKENKAVMRASSKMAGAVRLRDMFKQGSAEWNKYNKDVEGYKKSIQNLDSTADDGERAALVANDASFKEDLKPSKNEAKAFSNCNKNLERIKKARDRNAEGSAEWNKFNTMLAAHAEAGHSLRHAATSEERENIMAQNSALFTDNTSQSENKAMQSLDKNILAAKNNRDMFEEGSKEWNQYNNRIESLTQLGNDMQGITDKGERESFIKDNKEAFSDAPPKMNAQNAKFMSGINANIARAAANRDRHKEGSAKWNACNEEVNTLCRQRAAFEISGDDEAKTAFAESNKSAFTDELSGDKTFNEIENSRKNWMALAQSAGNPAVQEHAYKMAKAYTDYSEAYQRAGSPEGRQAVADKMNAYETTEASGLAGVEATPKEVEGLSAVVGARNETALKQYVNASSHAERSQILRDIKEGKITRFEVQNNKEKDFGGQLAKAGSSFAEMAEKAEKSGNKEEAARYTALTNYCSEAAKTYDGLATHAQRENFAKTINSDINSAQQKVENKIDSPKMALAEKQTLDYSENEQKLFNSFFSGSDNTEYERTSEFRTAFVNAKSHEERDAVMQSYGNYMFNAESGEKPGNWNKVDKSKLSAEPSQKTMDAIKEERQQETKSKYLSGIDANIARAVTNRDRHKEGSAKWNACNEQVEALSAHKTAFMEAASTEEGNDIAASNESVFTDSLSGDKSFNQIEKSIQAWDFYSQCASDPDKKEHGRKMAKAYANFSEEYQNAGSDEERASVVSKVRAYEESNIAALGGNGIQATPKEIEKLPVIAGLNDQNAMRRYINAPSHEARSQFLSDVQSGAYAPQDSREADFGTSVSKAASQFETLAATEEASGDKMAAARYRSLSNYCRQASNTYNSLGSHAQRDVFARVINSEISEAQEGLHTTVETPRMASLEHQTLDFSEDEKHTFDALFSGNNGNEYMNTYKFRTEYVNAESHEAREAIVKKYDEYVDKAGEEEQPGVWDNIGAFSASAMPSRSEVDTIKQDSASQPSQTPAPVRTEERPVVDRAQRVNEILNEFRTRHAETGNKKDQGGKDK